MEMMIEPFKDIASKYGLHFAFLVALVYFFFWKYVPDQAAALKEIVNTHDNRIKDLVSDFRQSLDNESKNTEKLFNIFTNSQEKILSSQEKILNSSLETLKLISDQLKTYMNKHE